MNTNTSIQKYEVIRPDVIIPVGYATTKGIEHFINEGFEYFNELVTEDIPHEIIQPLSLPANETTKTQP